VWGRDGMRTLWSAATIKLYGGGVSEVDFLTDLSRLIGEFTQHTTSVSHAQGGRTNTHATQRERILDVAELHAPPKRRAIVLAAGAPPTLLRTLLPG
jgi:type IV secretory pathway TraG/TraD family ATPase VirD4